MAWRLRRDQGDSSGGAGAGGGWWNPLGQAIIGCVWLRAVEGAHRR
jgi:hypothetical protein